MAHKHSSKKRPFCYVSSCDEGKNKFLYGIIINVDSGDLTT